MSFCCVGMQRGALPWVLSRIPEATRAIVVDNGSTDGSAELAARAWAPW